MCSRNQKMYNHRPQSKHSWAATRTMEIFTSGNLQLFWRKILTKMVSGY